MRSEAPAEQARASVLTDGLPLDDYAEVIPNLDQVKASLGEHAYAAAMTAGQALPTDQAIAEAEALCDLLVKQGEARSATVARA